MSHVVINAITVPAERGDELAARFAARAGQVEKSDGFEEFQLLRPEDGSGRWLVYTRWRDEAAFQAWASSPAFHHGHARSEGPGGPVGTASEIWQFSVAQRAGVPSGS
ncbi:MAG: antibiotic biosynthesis monooxygenase family protein [Acidimicrobiales bacterium]